MKSHAKTIHIILQISEGVSRILPKFKRVLYGIVQYTVKSGKVLKLMGKTDAPPHIRTVQNYGSHFGLWRNMDTGPQANYFLMEAMN